MTRPKATPRWRNRKVLTGILTLTSVLTSLILSGLTLAYQSGPAPQINPAACAFDASAGTLVIRGQNFERGATVLLASSTGQVSYARLKIKGQAKIVIIGLRAGDAQGGLDVTVINPDGARSPVVHIDIAPAAVTGLTQDDVKTIIAQAVARAEASGLKATIAVVDREANVLGVFAMQGAPPNTRVGTFQLTHRSCP